MPPDTAAQLILFAFASSITPGPNNLMLMASGVNHGVRRTVPHMLGISGGFFVMTVLVGIGAAAAFRAAPFLDPALRVLCIAFVLWIAAALLRAGAPGRSRATARPMTFLQAAAFQWVNPKAWAMALAATTVYAPTHTLGAVSVVAAVFAVVNLPSVAVWALAGVGLRGWLADPLRLRVFNTVMAALLLLSVAPILI